MCDKTEAKGSRESAFLPSVSIRLSYVPLTGTHENRGVGGLVCKNAEGMEKVIFLSLGGLVLQNLGGLILLSLGWLIILTISLVGIGRMLHLG